MGCSSSVLQNLFFQLIGILLVLGRAQATLECPCTFNQPILTEAGVTALPVTYTCQFDPWAGLGYAVIYTFAENSIRTTRGFENRNGASLAGLKCELVRRPEKGMNVFHGLFGDTLRVNLIIPPADSLKHFEARWGESLPEILAVTVQCMKVNAQQESSRYKFLSIELHGSPSDSALSGVFPVEASASIQEK